LDAAGGYQPPTCGPPRVRRLWGPPGSAEPARALRACQPLARDLCCVAWWAVAVKKKGKAWPWPPGFPFLRFYYFYTATPALRFALACLALRLLPNAAFYCTFLFPVHGSVHRKKRGAATV